MAEENQQAAQPQFALKRVYLKDASLETPNTPQIFTHNWQPEVSLEVNTKTNPLEQNHYEVVLTLTVTVKTGEETAFLVEVHQAAIFQLDGFDAPQLQHTLAVFCPNLLFPYAREAIDNMATKASFPALMLAPINFDALYAQKLQEAQNNTQVQ